MPSVTNRVKSIQQPRGGYIKLSQFETIPFQDNVCLMPDENIHPTVVGLAVDYLCRFKLGVDKRDIFRVSIRGASIAQEHGMNKAIQTAENLLCMISDIDDTSIINTCNINTKIMI